MKIDDLTIGEAKDLVSMFTACQKSSSVDSKQHRFIGKMVIIRTYSAGVFFGKLVEKDGNEVILEDARRLWRWWAAESISLSGVANYGIIESKSEIAPAVAAIWLEAIEIIPCTDVSIKSISEAKNAKAK